MRSDKYNTKKSIAIRQDGSLTVSAPRHRPLRAAKPWCFGFKGCTPGVHDATEGRCVTHQAAAATRKSLKLEDADIEGVVDGIFEDLYPPGSVDSPYEREAEDGGIEKRGWRDSRVTTAKIEAFFEEFTTVEEFFYLYQSSESFLQAFSYDVFHREAEDSFSATNL